MCALPVYVYYVALKPGVIVTRSALSKVYVYYVALKPGVIVTRSALSKVHVPPTKVLRWLAVKWQLPFVSKTGSN